MIEADDTWQLGDDWQRIVCIGDIHGDLDALVRLLLLTSLVDADGHWSAERSLLVLVGDLNDRGPDSVNVISYVMALQRQAPGAGGRVESLLGNHEMLCVQGDFRYARPAEVLAWEGFWFGELNGLHAVYRGSSPYAKWLSQRPTIVSAGRSLFVHAGIDSTFADMDPGELNATMSAWIAHFQGVAPEPDESTHWLTGQAGQGPLWTKRFVADKKSSRQDSGFRRMLDDYCHRWNVERLVCGHNPTHALDFRIAYPHPTFGNRVAVIDTGISEFFGGRLSALECSNDEIHALYAERGTAVHPLTAAIRARVEKEKQLIQEEERGGR